MILRTFQFKTVKVQFRAVVSIDTVPSRSLRGDAVVLCNNSTAIKKLFNSTQFKFQRKTPTVVPTQESPGIPRRGWGTAEVASQGYASQRGKSRRETGQVKSHALLSPVVDMSLRGAYLSLCRIAHRQKMTVRGGSTVLGATVDF